MSLNINNKCPLRCSYCFVSDKSQKEMTPKTLLEVLRYVYDVGGTNVDLDFFGTEPLMSMDIVELAVEWISLHELKWNLGIVTNAVLITPKIARFLKNNNFSVAVSYDGKTHDLFRKFKNNKGSRKRTRKGVRNLLEIGIQPTCLMCVHPNMTDKLLENVQDAYDLGFKHIWLNKVIENVPEYDQADINKAYKEVAEWYLETPVIVNFLHDTLTKKSRGDRMTLDNTCGACKFSIGIAIDGNIAPCHRLCYMGEYIGHINSAELELEKWRAKRFIKCNDCPIMYCFPCYAENKALTGSYDKIPAAWCIFESARWGAAMSIYDRWRENSVTRGYSNPDPE